MPDADRIKQVEDILEGECVYIIVLCRNNIECSNRLDEQINILIMMTSGHPDNITNYNLIISINCQSLTRIMNMCSLSFHALEVALFLLKAS